MHDSIEFVNHAKAVELLLFQSGSIRAPALRPGTFDSLDKQSIS